MRLLVILALVMALFCWSWVFVPSTAYEAPEAPETLHVMDKPLLTEEQKQTVIQTDSVALKLGNETIVIQHGAREALKGYY